MREKEHLHEFIEDLKDYGALIPTSVVAEILGCDQRTVEKHLQIKTLGRKKYVSKRWLAGWLA